MVPRAAPAALSPAAAVAGGAPGAAVAGVWRPGPPPGTTINILLKSDYPGCGLRVTQDTRDGVLEVGFEADALKLLKF